MQLGSGTNADPGVCSPIFYLFNRATDASTLAWASLLGAQFSHSPRDSVCQALGEEAAYLALPTRPALGLEWELQVVGVWNPSGRCQGAGSKINQKQRLSPCSLAFGGYKRKALTLWQTEPGPSLSPRCSSDQNTGDRLTRCGRWFSKRLLWGR